MRSTTVVDLNEVRHARLIDGVRARRERIADLVQAPPHWLDDIERVQWGFALGEAHRRLSEVLDAHARPAASWLHSHRSVRGGLVEVTCWMMDQCEERQNELASILAFEAVAELLAPLLMDAHVRPEAHQPASGSSS